MTDDIHRPGEKSSNAENRVQGPKEEGRAGEGLKERQPPVREKGDQAQPHRGPSMTSQEANKDSFLIRSPKDTAPKGTIALTLLRKAISRLRCQAQHQAQEETVHVLLGWPLGIQNQGLSITQLYLPPSPPGLTLKVDNL